MLPMWSGTFTGLGKNGGYDKLLQCSCAIT